MKDKQRIILFVIALLIWFLSIQIYIKSKYSGSREPSPSSQQEEDTGGKTSADRTDRSETATEDETRTPDQDIPEPELEALGTDEEPADTGPDPDEQPLPQEDIEEKTVLLDAGKDENSGYLVTMSNRGAAISSLVIKGFYEDERRKNNHLTLLSAEKSGAGALQITDITVGSGKKPQRPETGSRTWRISSRQSSSVSFTAVVAPGVSLTKSITFNEEENCFFVTLSQTNSNEKTVETSYEMIASPGVIPEYEDLARAPLKAVAAVMEDSGKEDLKTLYFRSVKKKPFVQEKGTFSWIAGCNKYFTVFLKLRSEATENCEPVIRAKAAPLVCDTEKNGNPDNNKPIENVLASVQILNIETDPGETSSVSFSFHALPLRKEDLKETGISYRELISPGNATGGVVDALAEFFLLILTYIHAVFPNWGIAIILLTCLVNAALYPLNKKGQISMHRMQKLQPKMKEIRKKYKNNKQKMNEEMMKLYHKHGVNPVGGCFPMLLQLPVFIGLLFALRSSFELRQSGFLWIEDLSLPDALFSLPFDFIPTFNLLPVLMAAAMLIQQKIASPHQEETKNGSQNEPDTQKQMQGAMKIMPWIMLVILYKFSSGLILYWTVNSALRIFETYHIRKRLIPRMEEKKSAAENG